MNTYLGMNTKTKYLGVINRINAFHIFYLSIFQIFQASILILLILFGITSNIILFRNVSFVFIFLLFFSIVTAFVFIVAKIILIIKNKRIIDYYKNNELINVCKIMINYDYKLWLTAVKDTFHPMSFNMLINDNIETYKTGIYFTNSERYNKIFKFKMPKALIARSYINSYAIVGYDRYNNEMIIIDVEK